METRIRRIGSGRKIAAKDPTSRVTSHHAAVMSAAGMRQSALAASRVPRRVARAALSSAPPQPPHPPPRKRSLYPGHLPTSPLQKVFVACASAALAIADPTRADMVGTLGEVTGGRALEAIVAELRRSEDGRRILSERPTVATGGPADAARLRSDCAPGTFGRAYGEFMEHHGFDADDRSPVALVDDADAAYALLRYRQVHDYWHVLTGLPPTLGGEVALKWFEVAHLQLPVALFSALLGPSHLTAAERASLKETQIPWALEAGAACAPLLAVPYEDRFHVKIDDLRADLRLRACPPG